MLISALSISSQGQVLSLTYENKTYLDRPNPKAEQLYGVIKSYIYPNGEKKWEVENIFSWDNMGSLLIMKGWDSLNKKIYNSLYPF